MPFAGFDVARYPGDERMQSLWDNSSLYWVGLYLPVAGPGLADKQTWMGTYSGLAQIGWGVAPIYVGKQPNSHKLALRAGSEGLEGYSDGIEAVMLAAKEGIPGNSVIYFDLEMPTNSAPWKDYYFGWATAVDAFGLVPGLYCSYLSAGTLRNSMKDRDPGLVPEVWAFNVDKFPGHKVYGDLNQIPARDPGESKGLGATSWQFIQGSALYWKDGDTGKHYSIAPVDLNTSNYSDPGARTATTS